MNAQSNNAETKAMNTNTNHALRFGKPILYTVTAAGAAIIGAIVIVNFAKLFAEMALTVSNLSVESTEGGLLVFGVYCTAFYMYFQWLPKAYRSFKEIVNSINITGKV